MESSSNVSLEKIVALAKRRGFVYQSADIYGGLNGTYDFGHLGTLMRKNIESAWTNSILNAQDDILFLDGAQLGPEAVWNASGHTENFHDPMVDCTSCKHRYRADEIDLKKACPYCGNKKWTDIKTFNMMFKTNVGASTENALSAYLRPETAQTIFVNFKNVMATNRVKIPFGIAQIGKAFRNEINPKNFLFRIREFSQMELEWFCKEIDADKFFTFWSEQRFDFYKQIGINMDKLRLETYQGDDIAHYSKITADIEYHFPFGWKELEGIAHRGDYDLTQHSKHSGKDLAVYDDEAKKSYTPNVIESSVGIERLFLTLMFDAYSEESVNGEERTVLKFHPTMAPIKAAVLPLSKKLSEKALPIYKTLKKSGMMIEFDETGSIGKRYRRQDEIGTPLCVTFDFESETDNAVTVRDRNTMEQKRIPIDSLPTYLENTINGSK